MRVLVACEFSGVVRDAFARLGHDAWSCDLLPTEAPGNHVEGDVLEILGGLNGKPWDLLVAHPPCTHIAVSGARHFWEKREAGLQEESLRFVWAISKAPVKRVCLENPVGVISKRIRKPDQIIQPYEYGANASKKTCLWLHNLPKLRPTCYVAPRVVLCPTHKRWLPRWGNQTNSGQNKEPPIEGRGLVRSVTYQGIADAMAVQWGGLK